MSDASVIDMVLNALPQITASAAAPLENVDSIIMYGEGNTTKLVKDVMNTSSQIFEGIKQSTGLDVTNLISQFLNNKTEKN